MTIEQFSNLPSEQRNAMRDLQQRSGMEWEEFLESAIAPSGIFNYVAIPDFYGMYVGIEEDGHTHS